MRMSTLLVILTSILDLASEGEGDKKKLELYKDVSSCCKTVCGGKYLFDKAEEKGEAVRDIINQPLVDCFELVKRNPLSADSPMCKSNSQLLISCIARYILMSCPHSAWKEEKDQCAGKKITFREEIAAIEEQQNKNDVSEIEDGDQD